MLCEQTLSETIHDLLRHGFTDAVIEAILENHPDSVKITTDKIRKNRLFLSEMGECPAFETRRTWRSPYAILRKQHDVRQYSPAMWLYSTLAPSSETVRLVDTVILVEAYSLCADALAPNSLDINDLYAIAHGWEHGDVCHRCCPNCGQWSLLAVDAPNAAERCVYCGERGITTGDVWFCGMGMSGFVACSTAATKHGCLVTTF